MPDRGRRLPDDVAADLPPIDDEDVVLADLPTLDDEAVRQRAYALYLERGELQGSAEDDWFRAESDLRDAQ